MITVLLVIWTIGLFVLYLRNSKKMLPRKRQLFLVEKKHNLWCECRRCTMRNTKVMEVHYTFIKKGNQDSMYV